MHLYTVALPGPAPDLIQLEPSWTPLGAMHNMGVSYEAGAEFNIARHLTLEASEQVPAPLGSCTSSRVPIRQGRSFFSFQKFRQYTSACL